MSDTRSVIDGASPTINTATGSVAFASGGDTSADLSAFLGAFVEVRASGAFRTRGTASATGACTAGDFPRSADLSYHFKITEATKFLWIRGNAAAGTLYYSRSSP